ncbi:hypothetical protein G6011_11199 [Alternaria panax]|uniref:Uncharacterized protein n=1 Tax=Alternaria panax TaxID=48097 RepID=A0AAD4IDC3_9PLEO|nr:hypothetical protein G6011_11199 [Alternaria panax]
MHLLDPGDDQRLWEGNAMVAPCGLPTGDDPLRCHCFRATPYPMPNDAFACFGPHSPHIEPTFARLTHDFRITAHLVPSDITIASQRSLSNPSNDPVDSRNTRQTAPSIAVPPFASQQAVAKL